jgi:hypothetical protein
MLQFWYLTPDDTSLTLFRPGMLAFPFIKCQTEGKEDYLTPLTRFPVKTKPDTRMLAS